MIQFETKPATPESSNADVKNYAKKNGLSDKEAARIFLKLGPNATSEEVAAEAKLFAVRVKSSNDALKKS